MQSGHQMDVERSMPVKKQVRLVLRIPIRVSVIDNKTGDVVTSSTYTKQRQLSDFVQLQVRENRGNDVTFEAKVMYDRKQESHNEFRFKNFKDFQEKLEPCLERQLLKELLKDKMVVKDYVQGL